MQPTLSSQYLSNRDELESVRLAFHRLLNDIPEKDWDRRLPDEGWTARQEMAHITQIIRLLPVGIRRATSSRKRSMLNFIPERLRRWVNGYIIVPRMYRLATRASIAEAYEAAHRNLLSILQALPEEAWSKSAFYPRQYRTVEQMAHRPAEHFQEHEAHLRRVLGINKL
jgi:DinB superfamily